MSYGSKVHFVTGGVVSGLGKGITAASLGRLLKARGYKVISQNLIHMSIWIQDHESDSAWRSICNR